ncbi:unnamed protein product [Rotaria sordida]|uniref:UBC core domain-containing protein n=1 Tax=Rotaria sordida TaxID=392033 RepID=A0A814PRX7_9BILA|nr:unnamed protein product [Rotaria sordida]CAF1109946.1 unnamed protein product [Rotaria sordida]
MYQLTYPDPNNILQFILTITPDDGYYKGGRFTFSFTIGPEYPYSPPKVKCFSSNGTLVAQIYNGTIILFVIASTLIALSSPFWTHIVQTWNSTNDLRLYIDNILVASLQSATTFRASGIIPNYVTLASSLLGSGSCLAGTIDVTNSFTGGVDNFRICSRELSATDVCILYIS